MDIFNPSGVIDTSPLQSEGVDETEGADEAPSPNAIPDLPTDPNDLLDQGFVETSHPTAAANGHRTFENPIIGETIRFAEAKEGRPGQDHYHVENSNETGKQDQYLDRDGNPVADGGNASHLYTN